jgi:hypothetical protein
MSTGLAFIALGLVVIQLLIGDTYMVIGAALVGIGFWQIYQAYTRFKRYRGLVRKLRKKERKLGLEVGEIE